MNTYLRKIDNVAKIFSLENSKYSNIFRFTLVLKEKINASILKNAIKKALEIYPGYKVKIKDGLFICVLNYPVYSYIKSNKK